MTPLEPAAKFRRVWLFVLLSLAGVLALALLLPDDLFLSAAGTDLTGQFAAWRAFAADSISAGHLPLWNPYTYAGQPFLGDFQSAELYPLNVIFLFLPLVQTLNLSFLLHLLILAWGMGYWCTRRGFHPAACALAGFTAALCGPVFPHLFGGHLASVCSMAWAPWILIFLENAWRGPARRPLLLAAMGVCLQILAGHPQYVFYTAIAAGLNALAFSVTDRSLIRRALPMTVVVYAGAAALAAAQLLPGFAAAAESVRQGKVEFSFASSFSFPPENLLTLFAPWFFGHLPVETYWGRIYLWEASVFMGVSGVILALFALGDREHRRPARRDLAVAALLFLLALGGHTPLLRILYDYFPGFGSFRTLAKFSFPMLLFVILMLGAGADAVVRGRLERKFFARGVLAVSLLVVVAGGYLVVSPEGIAALRSFIVGTHESYLGRVGYPPEPALATLGAGAAHSLLLAGGLGLIIGTSLMAGLRRPEFRWVPLALLPLEMLSFAWGGLGTSRWPEVMPDILAAYVEAHPGDYRVLNFDREDNGYFLGAPDLWGNDPAVLKRYAEFMTFAQQGPMDHVTQYVEFKYLPPILSLVRFRFAFVHADKGYQIVEGRGALPRVLLVQHYQVLPNRDAVFAAFAKPDFDPRQTVLLETEPTPRPQPSAIASTAKVTDSTTDSLSIEADTPAPAILLITDLYSRDWRARPLPGSTQDHYDVLPGDYIVRAIPLAAGHHHLMVVYDPPSWHTGLLVTAVAWLIWLGCWWLPRRSPG